MNLSSTSLPRLKAQKLNVERSASAKKFNVIYTADDIRRRFKPSDEIHKQYTAGGDLAVRAYLAQQQAA